MSSVPSKVKLRRWQIASVVVGLLILVFGIAVLRRFDPAEYSFYPKCAMHQLTGLHCAGCGATRAVGALAAGRFQDAIRYNPLLVLGFPVILAVVLRQRLRERQGASAWPALSVCLFIILVVYTLARNIPSPTRSIFAPPASISADQTPPADRNHSTTTLQTP
ncbi:DUF2752 domain-containing protein [Rubripirellula sp.]|jgi:hypothetical protein|nr:DUF2752 domain-containing protein [Rubripirellula sp.]MDB4749841.1 DUF2752 domain-containing protein [Rubripirellula sp.]